MKSEKEKMLSGELYVSSDPELLRERLLVRKLCHHINSISPTEFELRKDELLTELFGYKTSAVITPPFYCDYGNNIQLGENVYFNFNCVVLDVVKIKIGNNVLFGPNVQLLAASHPIDVQQRNAGLEYGREITIGDNVWVGGGAIVCPGVNIGSHAVIGAGSIVTKDIPESVVVGGNPCKIIRRLTYLTSN